MKPKTHNKTKKMRGGRKQTGGFLDGVFWNNKQPGESNQSVSDQSASSKPWLNFWPFSTKDNTSRNDTANPVVQEEEDSLTKTETEEQPDSKSTSEYYNGGRRRKRRQRRTKKRSKSKSKAKTT